MDKFKIRFQKALQLEQQGDLQKAIHEYALLAGEFPASKEAFLSLAALYSKIGHQLDALFCYEKAVAIEPDALSMYNIGNLYYKLEDYKKAAIFFERSRNIKSSFAPVRLMLALSYSRLRNFAAAEKCFMDVLAISPSNEIAAIALSMLKFEKMEYDLAEEFANRVLMINPDSNQARKIKANILLKVNRIEESESEFKHLAVNDNRYSAYSSYIAALPTETFTDRYGTLETKIDYLEKEANENNDPSKLVSLSLCYLLKGDSNAAVEFLFKARKAVQTDQ